MSIAFIACAEAGQLEQQARLLCRSIRNFGGRYRNAPIYTFQPRMGTAVCQETLNVFKELGVIHITEPLNTEFPDYGIGNKVFASAWAEEMLKEEILVFTDSDTVFINEPADLDLPKHLDGSARPVTGDRYCSTGRDCSIDPYWRKMYEIFGIRIEPYTNTSVDGERIRFYLSSGIVAVRRNAGLFGDWRESFLKLMRTGHIPPDGRIRNMDQLSLAATFTRAYDRIALLDGRYNYYLIARPRHRSHWRETALEDLIHIHYTNSFRIPNVLRRIEPRFNPDTRVFRWLENYLPLEPVDHAAEL